MPPLEEILQKLVNHVSPGEVRLNVSRVAWMRDLECYEVSIQTRSYDEGFTGKTIAEAIRSAAEGMEKPPSEGDIDPVVPSWYRVSRMQREVVERTLERYRARHMANAAAANIANNTNEARAEYAIADAFKAALESLEYEETDGDMGPLEKEVLAPRQSTSKATTKGIEIEQGGKVPTKEREGRLAATVKQLKNKNHNKAKRGRSDKNDSPDTE